VSKRCSERGGGSLVYLQQIQQTDLAREQQQQDAMAHEIEVRRLTELAEQRRAEEARLAEIQQQRAEAEAAVRDAERERLTALEAQDNTAPAAENNAAQDSSHTPVAPKSKIPLYFAADQAPTENIPPEAPLCYKFMVAGPDTQLQRLKSKYSDLYDEKILNNEDGSQTLLAKRRNAIGNVISYFYSTNPDACNDYQKSRFNFVNLEVRIKSFFNRIYKTYDSKKECWIEKSLDEWDLSYCMKISRIDTARIDNQKRIYVVVRNVDDVGITATSGLVGLFVLGIEGDQINLIASNPRLIIGARGMSPEDWQFEMIGSPDYWGWSTTFWFMQHGISHGTKYFFAPYGNAIRKIARINEYYDDSGLYGEAEAIKAATIKSTINFDSSQAKERLFPLIVKVSGRVGGKILNDQMWKIMFDSKNWIYDVPKESLLGSDHYDWSIYNEELVSGRR
jgi:hypothetical protein